MFVTLNQIEYREDSSNATDKYNRNYIRNQILPAFDRLDTKNRQGFYQTLSNVRKSLTLLDVLVEKFCDDFIFYEEDYIRINAAGFKNFSHPDLLLFHFLSDYGFVEVQIHQILENRKPGKVFLSKTHVLTIQNASWTLRKKEMTLISESTQPFEFQSPGKFYIGENDWEVSFLPLLSENRSFGVSVEKLSFPLFVRPWSPKDVFRPLQMKGSAKSVKKLLSEQKIPIENRKNKMVLVDANGVILALEGGFVDYNNCTNISGQYVLSITKNGQKIF
jgi:tRNA(Ile)-lysidine synthase